MCEVRMFDARSGAQEALFHGHRDAILALDVSRWDIRTILQRELVMFNVFCRCSLCFSDGTFVVSGGDDHVCLLFPTTMP